MIVSSKVTREKIKEGEIEVMERKEKGSSLMLTPGWPHIYCVHKCIHHLWIEKDLECQKSYYFVCALYMCHSYGDLFTFMFLVLSTVVHGVMGCG